MLVGWPSHHPHHLATALHPLVIAPHLLDIVPRRLDIAPHLQATVPHLQDIVLHHHPTVQVLLDTTLCLQHIPPLVVLILPLLNLT